MPPEQPADDYAITAIYSLPDEAWHLELELVAEQRVLMTAVVPDEDPAQEPTVRLGTGERRPDIPYAVVRRFVEQVDEEVRRSRDWMQLPPRLVAVVRGLRQEHGGAIDDADFPEALARVRAAVPEADLPAVLAAAFGRAPEGSPVTDCKRPSRPDA